jgi:hypothetical protein
MAEFRAALLRQFREDLRETEITVENGRASFAIAWFEEKFHAIELAEVPERPGSFLMQHHGPLGLSDTIDDALREAGFAGIQWSSTASGAFGAPHPW